MIPEPNHCALMIGLAMLALIWYRRIRVLWLDDGPDREAGV